MKKSNYWTTNLLISVLILWMMYLNRNATNVIIIQLMFMILWLIVIIINKSHNKTCHALTQEIIKQENFIQDMFNRFNAPVTKILQESQFFDNLDTETLLDIRQSAETLKQNLEDMTELQDRTEQKIKYKDKNKIKYNKYNFAIIGVLLIALISAIIGNTYMHLVYHPSIESNYEILVVTDIILIGIFLLTLIAILVIIHNLLKQHRTLNRPL